MSSKIGTSMFALRNGVQGLVADVNAASASGSYLVSGAGANITDARFQQGAVLVANLDAKTVLTLASTALAPGQLVMVVNKAATTFSLNFSGRSLVIAASGAAAAGTLVYCASPAQFVPFASA